MIALDDNSAVNQDSAVKTLVWPGNLTMSALNLRHIQQHLIK